MPRAREVATALHALTPAVDEVLKAHGTPLRRNARSSHAGRRPTSREQAIELFAQMVAEEAFRPKSIRRFAQLLRHDDPKIALAAWGIAGDVLGAGKDGGGGSRPVTINLNNHIARPPKDITPPKVAA